MVKTQADGENNQHSDHLGPWVKAMYPGIFVEVEEDVHNKLINRKWEIGNGKSIIFYYLFANTIHLSPTLFF
jgi:hypothetical protein